MPRLEFPRFKAWFSICSGVGLSLYLFCSVLSQREAMNKLDQENRIIKARIEMNMRRTAYFKKLRAENDKTGMAVANK